MDCDCECASEAMHDEYCELALMAMTKAHFLDNVESAVQEALETYKVLLTMGLTDEQAFELTIDEARTSANCFVGIGSCGSGGCKHA